MAESPSPEVQDVSGYDTWEYDLEVIMVLLGRQLDWIILKVASNLDWFYNSVIVSG